MRNILISASLALVAACSPAMAQNVACIPVTAALQLLEDAGETLQSVGMNGSIEEGTAIIVQMWANVEAGTWKLITVAPSQEAMCLVASGEHYRYIGAPRVIPGEEM